jgi:hypothetical protein
MELKILEAEKVVMSVSYSQQHRLVDGCQYLASCFTGFPDDVSFYSWEKLLISDPLNHPQHIVSNDYFPAASTNPSKNTGFQAVFCA